MDITVLLEKDKYYYYTAEPTHIHKKFAYAGKYVRDVQVEGLLWAAFQNYGESDEEVLIERARTGFIKVFPDREYVQLPSAKKLRVVCNAQENRHYYVTDFTEMIDKDNYNTILPLTKYVGKHTGCRMEGWGKDMREWSHFIKDGMEIIIEHTPTTAFYHAIV